MQGTAAAPTATLEGSVSDDIPEQQIAGLSWLVSWFESHGGSVSKVKLENLGGSMGLSLVTSEVVPRGDVVMSIPVSLCMTVQSALNSDLAPVLSGHPELMDSPDEVLALHLMHEKRKGEQSFWREYIRTLPDDVDTPVRWTEEEEVGMLNGTMVGLLSKMMAKQVRQDWEEVHLPLIEVHPELLQGITFEDYVWAMSSIWSRAFDYSDHNETESDGNDGDGERGTQGGTRQVCRRAMVPVINAANHDPSAGTSLADIISFEESSVGSETDKGGRHGEGYLHVRAGRDYDTPGEQFFILYGRYSNAKLLYSYGFVLPHNPYGSVDYWVRIPKSDSGFPWKQALLDGHSLTAVQGYDFSGTLRAGGWVSPALLATARIVQLTPDERPAAKNAFEGKIVSVRNEAAALGALLAGLRRKLIGQNNPSVDDETQLIATLLERQQQQQQQHQEKQRRGMENGVAELLESGLKLRRQIAAARVRLEEKLVVMDAIGALEGSLQELRSTSDGPGGGGGGVGGGAVAGLIVPFRPLDAARV